MTLHLTGEKKLFKPWISKLLLSAFLIIGSQNLSADVVSLESNYVPGQSDVTTKLNNDRNALTNGVNNVRGTFAGSVQSSGQLKAGTVGAENMADDANPVNRTNEGASCPDLVASGLLPATSSSLVLTIPTGIAYPDGVRISKTSTTAANLTASKWTYYYLLTSGSFSTNVISIGASTPTPPASSATLFRASSDSTTINTITDLRRTSCASGPFSAISDVTGEGTLSDIFTNGQHVRRYSNTGRTPTGLADGMFVSFDTTTTFKVTSGVANINGKYRSVSSDTTIAQTNATPASGISGLDTGAIQASTKYFVYAAADQDAVGTASYIYSSNASTPAGATNFRLLGSLRTDINKNFTSTDVVTVHGISEREMPFAWIRLDGTNGAPKIKDSFNIASLAENVTGDWSVTFNSGPNTANFSATGSCGSGSGSLNSVLFSTGTLSTTGARFFCQNTAATLVAAPDVSVNFIGDNRK